MKSKTAVIWFLLVVSFGVANAQEYLGGYVIDNKNDTIQGKILNASGREITQKIVFKKTDNSLVTYYPKDIKAFLVGKEFYISGSVDNASYFLRELVKGYFKVYMYNTTGQKFCAKKGDLLIPLDKNTYIQDLERYCSDCKPLNFSDVTTFEQTYPFEKAGIAKFAYNYNMWMFKEYPVATEQKVASNRLKSRFGVFVGLESQTTLLKTSSIGFAILNRTIPNNISPLIGVLYQKGISDGLSLQIELIYTKVNFEYVGVDDFDKITWTNSYKTSIFRLPVGGSYNFLRGKKFSPFVSLGYQFIFRTQENAKFFIRTNPVKFSTGSVWRGVIFGAGINYKTSQRIYFLQLRYAVDSMIDFESKVTSVGRLNTIQLTGGIKI